MFLLEDIARGVWRWRYDTNKSLQIWQMGCIKENTQVWFNSNDIPWVWVPLCSIVGTRSKIGGDEQGVDVRKVC